MTRHLNLTDTKTKALLTCGAIAGPLFILVFLIVGATRGGGYDPLRHPISSLSIGDLGWMQMANFIITGLLLLAFSVGLRRTLRGPSGSVWGPLLVGLVGIHDLFGIPFFLGLPIACFVFTRLFGRWGEGSWAAYSALSGFAMFAVFFVARLGFRLGSEDLMALFGLLQRITVIIGFAWLTLLAVPLLRAPIADSKERR